MQRIKLMTDSACDLPGSLARQLGIEVIPIPIAVDGKGYLEGVDFTPREFYTILQQAKQIPTTSQISPVTYCERYHAAYQQGYTDVILMGISSTASATYLRSKDAADLFFENCPQAKESFRIHIIDSKTFSLGYGYPLTQAAQMIQDGKTAEEILAYLTDWVERIDLYITAFSFEFIKKSGRISCAASIVGEALGINSIPTTILLNPEGEVELINPNVITTPGQLRAMLDYAINGADSATLSYVQANLLNESGSVKRAAGSTTTSSAAQGLLAQYAVDSLNKSLLDTQRQWVLANGSTGDLGDDLALLGALSSWRGYEGDAATLGETIVNTYFADGQLNGQVALSDLDLESMMLLGRGAPYDEALSAIQKGFIGAQFPLYYSEYNADKGTYNHQVIDTADALTTVYHLAQVGKVRKQTINWLYDQVEGDGLRARYTTDGEVVATYNYETPALYALTALIALEAGEEDLFTQSVMLMETCRTFDTASTSNGSFTTRNKDSAFDQCAALLVYAKMQQE